MLILRTLVFAAVAVSQVPSPLLRSDAVLVTRVIDGGTIQVQTFGRVKLLGIDVSTPGPGPDASADLRREARDRLIQLVLRRWVRLERTARSPSAYVHTEDGQFVNVVLVREGLARVRPQRALSRLDELQRAEDEARRLHRGMWKLSSDAKHPE